MSGFMRTFDPYLELLTETPYPSKYNGKIILFYFITVDTSKPQIDWKSDL
jgi:hypothetical protein